MEHHKILRLSLAVWKLSLRSAEILTGGVRRLLSVAVALLILITGAELVTGNGGSNLLYTLLKGGDGKSDVSDTELSDLITAYLESTPDGGGSPKRTYAALNLEICDGHPHLASCRAAAEEADATEKRGGGRGIGGRATAGATEHAGSEARSGRGRDERPRD